ncbi:MAG: 3-deoxy-manno-octulosonate cytidylyltransferase [Deltaproteobacteria bacterium]|nr:3-deoxy-manno-octulosonate cytidylyltransferase [Deltaproteobacteria bacterium]
MSSPKKSLVVIPSRLASTRLPAKALKDIAGKPLVQRCYEKAKEAKLVTKVVVATDAQEIADQVKSFGGEVVMTGAELTCGSQRVFQAASYLSGYYGTDPDEALKAINETWDLVINFQGDMPFMSGKIVDETIAFYQKNKGTYSLVTIAVPIFTEEEFNAPKNCKVVVSARGEGLYFSRAPIPFDRDGDGQPVWAGAAETKVYGFQHIGLYLYTPTTLRLYATTELSRLESIEKLEQLRVLEAGERIGVVIVDPRYKDSFADINEEEDLLLANKLAKEKQL